MQSTGQSSDAVKRQIEMDCLREVNEVTAITKNDSQEETKLEERGADITLAIKKQMLSFRRKMYLMACLLAIALLIAIASLGLAVKSLHQPTSASATGTGKLYCLCLCTVKPRLTVTSL